MAIYPSRGSFSGKARMKEYMCNFMHWALSTASGSYSRIDSYTTEIMLFVEKAMSRCYNVFVTDNGACAKY
jgi:hypothetical protein